MGWLWQTPASELETPLCTSGGRKQLIAAAVSHMSVMTFPVRLQIKANLPNCSRAHGARLRIKWITLCHCGNFMISRVYLASLCSSVNSQVYWFSLIKKVTNVIKPNMILGKVDRRFLHFTINYTFRLKAKNSYTTKTSYEHIDDWTFSALNSSPPTASSYPYI